MIKRKKQLLVIACGWLLLVLVYALFLHGPVYRTEVTVSVIRNPAPGELVIGSEAGDGEGISYFKKLPGEDREYIDQERFEDLRRRGAQVTGQSVD